MAKALFEFLFYLQLIQRLKYLVVSSTIGTLTLVSSPAPQISRCFPPQLVLSLWCRH